MWIDRPSLFFPTPRHSLWNSDLTGRAGISAPLPLQLPRAACLDRPRSLPGCRRKAQWCGCWGLCPCVCLCRGGRGLGGWSVWSLFSDREEGHPLCIKMPRSTNMPFVTMYPLVTFPSHFCMALRCSSVAQFRADYICSMIRLALHQKFPQLHSFFWSGPGNMTVWHWQNMTGRVAALCTDLLLPFSDWFISPAVR